MTPVTPQKPHTTVPVTSDAIGPPRLAPFTLSPIALLTFFMIHIVPGANSRVRGKDSFTQRAGSHA